MAPQAGHVLPHLAPCSSPPTSLCPPSPFSSPNLRRSLLTRGLGPCGSPDRDTLPLKSCPRQLISTLRTPAGSPHTQHHRLGLRHVARFHSLHSSVLSHTAESRASHCVSFSSIVPQECALRAVETCPFDPRPNPQHLGQCLAHSRCSINVPGWTGTAWHPGAERAPWALSS